MKRSSWIIVHIAPRWRWSVCSQHYHCQHRQHRPHRQLSRTFRPGGAGPLAPGQVDQIQLRHLLRRDPLGERCLRPASSPRASGVSVSVCQAHVSSDAAHFCDRAHTTRARCRDKTKMKSAAAYFNPGQGRPDLCKPDVEDTVGSGRRVVHVRGLKGSGWPR